MELISVIIPYYNKSATIERCLSSLRRQSGLVGEVIVVDDFSDKSESEALFVAVSNYSDSRVSVYSLHMNSGPSYARNYGIERARYPNIFLLDADDEFVAGKVDAVLKVLSSCDIVVHDYCIRTAGGNDSHHDYALKDISYWSAIFRNPGGGGSSISFNKERVSVRFRDDMRYCEDYAFVVDALVSHARIVKMDGYCGSLLGRPLNSYGGLSSNRIKMRYGEIKAVLQLFNPGLLRWLMHPVLFLYAFTKELYVLLLSKCSGGRV